MNSPACRDGLRMAVVFALARPLSTHLIMSESASHAVFLSYARDDAAAARRIAEALRSNGLEVWFDENELRHRVAWKPLRGDPRFEALLNDPKNNAPLF